MLFPFLNLNQTLWLLRVGVALIFISHAAARLALQTTGRFAQFLSSKGFLWSEVWVYALTTFEILGGLLLALGFFRKWLSAGFILILGMGIFLIHASLGWFVGEHGTGGSEYSFILILALLVIAAHD
jgi:putative oxidoreductase